MSKEEAASATATNLTSRKVVAAHKIKVEMTPSLKTTRTSRFSAQSVQPETKAKIKRTACATPTWWFRMYETVDMQLLILWLVGLFVYGLFVYYI